MLMTSSYHPAMYAGDASRLVEKQVAMGLRKKIASLALGTDVDELCLAFFQVGLEQGFNEGVETATNDIVTDILSDAVLSMEVDVEVLQRIVEIIEN